MQIRTAASSYLNTPQVALSSDNVKKSADSAKSTENIQQKDNPEQMKYTVPIGESGANLMKKTPDIYSFQRLYSFEKIHAAAHRTLAKSRGQNVENQNVRIRTGITKDGDFIAVAGATETKMTSDSSTPGLGDSDIVRELAFFNDSRRMLVGCSSTSMGFSQRPAPKVIQSGTAASDLRARNNSQYLRKKFDSPSIMEFFQSQNHTSLKAMQSAYDRLDVAAMKLVEGLGKIGNGISFAGVSASGGDPVAEVNVTSAKANIGSHDIRVHRLASAQEVKSTQWTPGQVKIKDLLNSEGEKLIEGDTFAFKLNGIDVKVSSEATLDQLELIINFGEDNNQNGELDYTKSAYYNFDSDNDGDTEVHLSTVLDVIEDADGDGELDGGTAEHGVIANMLEGYLTLTSAETGPSEIKLEDIDRLLAALGMHGEDSRGMQAFEQEIMPAASAHFELDGNPDLSASNTLKNSVEGVTLELLKVGDDSSTFKVSLDKEAFSQDVSKLVDTYNKAIQGFNDTLSPKLSGVLKNEPHIYQTYQQMRIAVNDRVPTGEPGGYASITDAGLNEDEGLSSSFYAIQLQTAVFRAQSQNSSEISGNARYPSSVYNALNEIGVISEDDHTLILNMEELTGAIEENLSSIRSMFVNEDEGVVSRINVEAALTADPLRGRLAFGRLNLHAQQLSKRMDLTQIAALQYKNLLKHTALQSLPTISVTA